MFNVHQHLAVEHRSLNSSEFTSTRSYQLPVRVAHVRRGQELPTPKYLSVQVPGRNVSCRDMLKDDVRRTIKVQVADTNRTPARGAGTGRQKHAGTKTRSDHVPGG